MAGRFDPGSFKDPEGRVFLANGEVYRTLGAAAEGRMRALADDGVLDRLAARRRRPQGLTANVYSGLLAARKVPE